MVPRKLYKAWDSENEAMVALKLVELYGFAAASAWAEQHLAVSSRLVRYAVFDARIMQMLRHQSMYNMPLSVIVYYCPAVVRCSADEACTFLHLQRSAGWVFSGIYALAA